MANLQERRDKEGNLISYSIRVHRGRDSGGKQLKPYSTTFDIPEGWNDARALKEANKQAILFEKKCKDGLVADEKQTFEEYAAYVMKIKEKNQKHRTVERYYGLLKRVIPAIGHLKISEIRPQHLNKLYDNLAEEGQNLNTGGKLSNKTIVEYHRLISTILAQAEKEMLIPFNPAHRSSPPKILKTKANNFQIADVNKIINCLENEPIKWKAITYLLMFSGCRRGEILGLKWDKVELDTGVLTIDNTLLYTKDRGTFEDTTKTGRNRSIKLPPEAIKIFKEYRLWYLKEQIANGDRWFKSNYVFVQEAGKPMHPNSITIWLSNFAKRYELKHINPHAFRHSYGSILINNGVDIVTVSKLLGHQKVSTTLDIYAHLMTQASEEASECIADAIFPNRKKKGQK